MRQPSLGRNAVYKALLNLFNLVVPLLVGPYINGLLYPEQLGLYNRAFSEFQVFQLIGAFGIYNYGVRELSRLRRDSVRQRQVYSALFWWGVLLNAMATAVFVGFFLIRALPSEWAVYAVLLVQMLANVFYMEFFNEAEERYGFIAAKTLVIRFLYLISMFIFVRKPGDVVPYALVISVTVLANNLASYFMVYKQFPLQLRNLEMRKHFWPLLVTFLLTNCELLYAQVDRVLLGPYGSYLGRAGDVTVTLYNLPFTLVGMLASVPVAVIAVALPRLSSELALEGEGKYLETFESCVTQYLSLLLPLCLGLLVVSPEALGLYTRGVYTYAWPVLALACIGRLVYGIQYTLNSLVLYLYRAEKFATILLFLCGLGNVGVKALLVYLGQLTPLSAMATTLVSVLFFCLLAWIYIRRILRVPIRFGGRRVLGYCVVSLLFLPVSLGVRALHLPYFLQLGLVILVCVTGYGTWMWVSHDPLAERVRMSLGRLVGRFQV